jgi:hypothetical protein
MSHRRQKERQPLSDYSSDSYSDPPPKKEKKKPQPLPTENAAPALVDKPKRVKLSQSRRLEIITNKRNGIEDPEYSAVQNPDTGAWRVSKRKQFLSPTAKVESTSPPGQDIHLTWMNMQASVNESLGNELERLSHKYEKLSHKYQDTKEKKKPKPESKVLDLSDPEPPEEPPQPPPQQPPQRQPPQPPQRQQQPPPQPQFVKRASVPRYRGKRFDVRDF